MKRLLRWSTMRINRRTALRGALGTTFGAIAAATVGRPAGADVIITAACTGPNGTGQCASSLCVGYRCEQDACVVCNYVTGFCDNDACWTSPQGGTCCDCVCGCQLRWWYCYCHGTHA